MTKITPFLWFDHQAEEAARYYISIFPNSRITEITHYNDASSKASGQPEGSVMTVGFELDGQRFVALNGGGVFQFTEAISFVIDCATQAEIDRYWEQLSAGGSPGQCGWLKDKYGVSWQVVPANLATLIREDDPERSQRVIAALMEMTKLDIAVLQRARRGGS